MSLDDDLESAVDELLEPAEDIKASFSWQVSRARLFAILKIQTHAIEQGDRNLAGKILDELYAHLK